jgi:parallel beta-helix repeat protein
MSGSIISGNHTSGNGGGIFLRNSSSFLIERCVVADNSCQENGGGIAIYRSRGTREASAAGFSAISRQRFIS